MKRIQVSHVPSHSYDPELSAHIHDIETRVAIHHREDTSIRILGMKPVFSGQGFYQYNAQSYLHPESIAHVVRVCTQGNAQAEPKLSRMASSHSSSPYFSTPPFMSWEPPTALSGLPQAGIDTKLIELSPG